MHRADHGEAVFRLGVADRVPARQQSAGGAHLLLRGREDRAEHLHRQLLRERCDRQREQRHPSHREDVVERVRGGDRTVVAGVIDDRREEVEREDQRTLVVEPVDRGVVRRRKPDEQVLRLDGHEPGQELLEARRRVLRGAAAARGEICQFHASGLDVHGESS